MEQTDMDKYIREIEEVYGLLEPDFISNPLFNILIEKIKEEVVKELEECSVKDLADKQSELKAITRIKKRIEDYVGIYQHALATKNVEEQEIY